MNVRASLTALGLVAFLEQLKKLCSHSKLSRGSGLFEFWRRFGSVAARCGHAPSPKPCQNSKILASNGCTISLIALICAGCQPPGKPTSDDVELKPADVRDFSALYAQNCAGCHGQGGSGNGALALANPVYLAIASDDVIRRATAAGIKGSLMPTFAKSAGGTLTDAQIDTLVHGMRGRWAKPQEVLRATLPAYASSEPGDGTRGAGAYAIFCAHCHGTDGTNARSSIVDGSFLALVSDQDLRTTIIAGRPDLGHPDWRHDAPGRAMTSQEVTDVVAWLVAQRKANPGQPYTSSN